MHVCVCSYVRVWVCLCLEIIKSIIFIHALCYAIRVIPNQIITNFGSIQISICQLGYEQFEKVMHILNVPLQSTLCLIGFSAGFGKQTIYVLFIKWIDSIKTQNLNVVLESLLRKKINFESKFRVASCCEGKWFVRQEWFEWILPAGGWKCTCV